MCPPAPTSRAAHVRTSARALWWAAPLIASLLASRPDVTRADSDACAELARHRPSPEPRLSYLKMQNVLCLIQGDQVLWSRSASHGSAQGKKRFEGDRRTPEGRYRVWPARKSRRFTLFLAISYPNADDLRRARAAGKRAGGGVGIHGPQRWYAFLGQAQALLNHSDGCIVLDEPGIRELAARVKRPLPIEIWADLPR